METKEIFGAAPFSVSEFFSDPGLGLYIPPYQRPYSWERGKVRRLVEDIGHGLAQLMEINESICFLGTVIALRDTNYTTVEPVYQSQVPAKLLTIIDGQQRLSSLLILLTVLQEEIRMRARALNAGTPGQEWCKNQARDVTARLAATFQENMNYGDAEYQYYPRMIRAYDDVWSRQRDQARYTSAIANFLFEYAKHSRSEEAEKKAFAFRPDESSLDADSDTAGMASFRHVRSIRDDVRNLLRKELRTSSSTDDDEMDPVLLPAADISASKAVQHELFSGGVPEEVLASIPTDKAVADVLRLVVFANYLLQRVTVAVVTAKREDFGFDMFEALNTTGEPLTALETFKPRVINVFTLSGWRTSKTKTYFDRVESYLGGQAGASADRRQTATADLLVSFALLQSGRKLGKRLSEQRRYMRQSFDEEPDDTAKSAYVEAMSHLTSFLDGPWRNPAKLTEDMSTLESEASFSIAVLQAGKHDIVIPLLARYWTAYRLAESAGRQHAYEEFLRAARSCAAFYGLWRAALRGTAGIDDVHRSLMASHDSDGLAWARESGGNLTAVPSTNTLNDHFRQQLAERSLDDPGKWAKLAANNATAAHRALTRFLLIAASQDSLPDDKVPGLVKRGKPGLLTLMTVKHWVGDTMETIEHIAPESPGPGNEWNIDTGDNPDLINTLGNLTLLPGSENSSAGDKSWPIKRVFYRALSAATLVDAERLIEAAAAEGVTLHQGAQEIVNRSQFLPQLSALGSRDEDWNAAFIRLRGERLAELIWGSLAPWIGLES